MTVSTTDLVFPFVSGKSVIARFDGGDITSDAGALLLAQADRKLSLCESLACSILDKRDPTKIAHTVDDLLRERIFAIALGYEDANDLDTLAHDPALRAACGRKLCAEDRLASQPTISRLENGVDSKDLLVMSMSLAQIVVNQLPSDTKRVVLDVDASEDPCHGQQEFEFFNRYYDSHCYLPLLLHVTADGDRQRLMAAMLRPGRADSKTGLFGMLLRALKLIHARFPQVKVILRADGGFGQAEVIEFCTLCRLPFVLGLPTNARLKRLALPFEQSALKQASDKEETVRYYAQFTYKADTWSASHRVVDRIEITRGEINARFVVSNMSDLSMQELYEFYCERGEQENRIKELKLDLASGRTSCHRFYANQFRLLLHAAASVLMCAIQDGLVGTHLQNAQAGTIRLKILKVGAQAKESLRVLWFRLSSTFVNRDLWYLLYSRLSAT